MRPRSSAFLPMVAAVAVLAAAADAFARAGGGGNFGGGGGGSGGGGDGIPAWLIIQLIRLCFRHPLIGIPILIVVIVYFVKFGKRAQQTYRSGVLTRGGAVIEARRESERVAEIRGRDASFDPEAFASRVGGAFMKTQAAWCAQDLTPVRPFVSDGVHERFAMQIAEQRELGYADRMDGLAVQSVRIVHSSFVGAFDAVTVRVNAVAADYRVALGSGDVVAGSRSPEPFAELWTFVRRRGARLAAGRAGLLEGNCPNCGDAVTGNQFADCRTCRSRLRSGEFDWVLTEITQPGEWAPREARFVPGVAALAEADPEFSAEAMEDRASAAFWRWAMAMRTGDVRHLAGVAADEVVRETASGLAASATARRFVGECGVGGVVLLGVVRRDGIDRALVEVRWSGTEFEARPGSSVRRLERTGVRANLFVFERSSSLRTKSGESFASAHCGGCGAPASGSSALCAYCGQPLTGVTQGWTLVRIGSRHDAAGRVLLAELRTAEGAAPAEVPSSAGVRDVVPEVVLVWAARVAASDGVVDAKERDGLTKLAARCEVSPARLAELLADAVNPASDPPLPSSPDEARRLLEHACRAAIADGQLTPEEFALLQRLAGPAGMSAADVRILVNRVRAETYAEAKAALRSA